MFEDGCLLQSPDFFESSVVLACLGVLTSLSYREVIGEGGGPKKVTYVFWGPHGDMLQFLPPRVPPQSISVAVHGGGAWKM